MDTQFAADAALLCKLQTARVSRPDLGPPGKDACMEIEHQVLMQQSITVWLLKETSMLPLRLVNLHDALLAPSQMAVHKCLLSQATGVIRLP